MRINLRLDRLTAHRVDLSEVTERGRRHEPQCVARAHPRRRRGDPVRGFPALSAIHEIGGLPLNDRGFRVSDVADVTYRQPPIPYGRHLNDEAAIG